MSKHWQAFLIALEFLTAIPVSISERDRPNKTGVSLLYYPVVGMIIAGVVLLVIYLLNSQTDWVVGVLSLTVWVALTGGLHLDGLADSADAWLGGLGDKTTTLHIMKDPTSGPIAVVVLLLVLLIKLVMLTELIMNQQWVGIVLAIVLARMALPLLLLTTPYVRPNGLGAELVKTMPRKQIRIMIAIIGLLAVIVMGLIPLMLFLTALLIMRYYMLKRLDGTTGDTAGAMVELLETTTLILCVIY